MSIFPFAEGDVLMHKLRLALYREIDDLTTKYVELEVQLVKVGIQYRNVTNFLGLTDADEPEDFMAEWNARKDKVKERMALAASKSRPKRYYVFKRNPTKSPEPHNGPPQLRIVKPEP
jgi:hypothetical protein